MWIIVAEGLGALGLWIGAWAVLTRAHLRWPEPQPWISPWPEDAWLVRASDVVLSPSVAKDFPDL